MKRMTWRTALFSGLIYCASSAGLWAQTPAEVETSDSPDALIAQGKEKDKDGGGGKGGKGDDHGGNSGGGAGQKDIRGGSQSSGENRGGSAPHSGGGGRVPSSSGQRPPSDVGPRLPGNRSPSFSRPSPSRQPGAVTAPSVRIRPSVNPEKGIPGGKEPRVTVRPDDVNPGTVDVQGNVRVDLGQRRSGWSNSNIRNRPFTGFTVNFNNRQFNVGHRSYQPSYYRHDRYHGYWNGNRGSYDGSRYGYGLDSSLGYGLGFNSGYSGYGWGLGSGYGGYGGGYSRGYGGYRYRPFGWGLGGWGLGSLYYHCGYLMYTNPYYVNSGPVYYNYSQPIPVSYNAPVTVVVNAPDSADAVFNNAVAAFRQNDYDRALDITNQGITQHSDDAVLHEFRSLVLFAKRDYQQSAGTIHSVLAVGPGWDWTTLIGLYANASLYTDQLRDLEAFTKANPQDAASHFLLAYHYMTCGHPDDAVRKLQVVVQLMPNDRVASDILKMIGSPLPTQPDGATTPLAPSPAEVAARPAVPPVAAASLVGTWTAARADGSTFDLNLTNAATFTWSFAQKNQPVQAFGGTYTVEGNVLALERKDGGSLIAEITPAGGSMFNFRMLGAPEDDKGLDFQK
jgi:tetratricopeptide (TPR) repeat protein